MKSPESRPRRIRISGLVLTFVAASYWPLHILAVNLFGVVRPERVLGLILIAWVLGLALVLVLVAFGLDMGVAESTAFVAMVLVMSGQMIWRDAGTLVGSLLFVAIPVLAGLVFTRFKRSVTIRALLWAVAVALAAGPILTLIESWGGRGEDSVLRERAPLEISMSERPDIFLVVLDGYPGMIGAGQDGLGRGIVDISSELRERGFEVPASTWAAYWATSLSIPSLLEMDYPVRDEGWDSGETQKALQAVLAGDSVVVETLRAQGYVTHMIETGWSAASCGSNYDRCIPSPLLDEATNLILRNTIASPLLRGSPGPYVLGTLAAFDWLMENGPNLSESTQPDFVYAHVVSPHAPFLLNPDCSAEFSNERAGTVFDIPGVSEAVRAGYLSDQMDCLDRLMIRFADSVDPEDVVIFVSDHGSDRRDQSDPATVNWDREMIVERLNTFVAAKLPDECELGEEITVPNTLRVVLGCLSSTPIELLPERMWVNPMVELDSEFVDELLGMRGSPESLEN